MESSNRWLDTEKASIAFGSGRAEAMEFRTCFKVQTDNVMAIGKFTNKARRIVTMV